ncbi:MAG: signal peptide peptidase SppA [Kangiellaceae bacterium]|nr:signal peptide peptidase SppA [Kangiellaceae bacterium]
MEKPNSAIGKVFYYLWKLFDINRRVWFGIFGLILSITFINTIFGDGDKIKIPQGAALVFAPKGIITEQPQWIDPVEEAIGESLGNAGPAEESIYDLLEILKNAKDDDRIETLVIYPGSIASIGPAMMEMLRDGVADFKTSGKKVYAMGDFYSQQQYYIAALADEVYVHPYGGVILEGLSRVRTYYASMLKKLKVTPNVFKVGTYKSAIEPYLLDGMSDKAKEANRAFLADLWTAYKNDIAAARGIDANSIDENINNYAEIMKSTNGDFATIALDQKLVDGLKSRPEFREMMIDIVGENKTGNSFKQVSHNNYLKAIKPASDFISPSRDRVAIIVAKGAIMDGNQKEGTIGGNTLASKIRRARLHDNTKAIVLRVDSPGGSAFASEVIREEIVKAKEQGLPVIVSMGTYAASGGYWISANADEIWARPTTITGSIGIFGFIPTFENTLAWAGVYRDGVGTTELAGAMDVGKGLSQRIKDILQTNINQGYQRFLNLVANGRNMTIEEVDKIAQGRVWSGIKAKELGLVDQLGSLNDAIDAAAKRAGIEGTRYVKWFVKRKLTQQEQLIKQLLDASAEQVAAVAKPQTKSAAEGFISSMQLELNRLKKFNDPNHAYVDCQCVID